MRYYAGNWATTQWLFRKDPAAEAKLDSDVKKSARIILDQVGDIYDPETASYLLNRGLAFRALHSHGRALNALLPRAAEDVDAYDAREGSWSRTSSTAGTSATATSTIGSCCRRSRSAGNFEPGDVRMIFLESEPTIWGEGISATRSGTPPTGCSRRARWRSPTWWPASPGSTSPSTSR